MSVKITVIYPTDPLGCKVGGGETFIKGFIQYAPEDFNIDFVGISSASKKNQSKVWSKIRLDNTEFNFFPLFFEKGENKKTAIPLSLRFTFALKFSKLKFHNSIILFNRLEPAVLFKKVECPKVVIIHNDITKQLESGTSEVFWSKIPRIYFMLEKYIFNFLDYVYTVNTNTEQFYKSRYSGEKKKFAFLPTWVDRNVFHPTDSSKMSIRRILNQKYVELPLEGKWILFVGRLQEQKAPIRLIDVFSGYHTKNRASVLIMIGEGNLKYAIEKHVKKFGLKDKVFLISNMPQEKLADFYRASDTLLLTSNFEGMPMCALEALGCGIPVVSTNVGEINRVVKNGVSGEVVNSFSPEIIAQAIEKVVNNPNIYLKENCLKLVIEFTPMRVLTLLYDTLRKLYKEKYGNN